LKKVQNESNKFSYYNNYNDYDRRNTHTHDVKSTLSSSTNSPNFLDKNSMSISNNESPKVVSEFINCDRIANANLNSNLTPQVDLLEFEKLKEDYFTIYEEKKLLLNQLNDYETIKVKCHTSTSELANLQLQYENLQYKFKHISDEKNIIHERLSKVIKENNDMNQNINSLKESVKTCEIDKNNLKTKISNHNNKVKFCEKEIANLKKKNQNLNFQVKNLTHKLDEEKEMRNQLEKRNEDNLQEFENKLAILENEKQKLMKETFLSALEGVDGEDNNNNFNEENCFKFHFIPDVNIIEIFLGGEKIAEAKNRGEWAPPGERGSQKKGANPPHQGNTSPLMKIGPQIDENFTLNKEYSFINIKKGGDKGKRGITTSPAVNKCISLRKLFSNNNLSISSKNSNLINQTPNLENKENINSNNNSNSTKSKMILISNFSSNKKRRFKSEFKIDGGENDKKIFPFQFDKIDNCIQNANFNNNNNSNNNFMTNSTSTSNNNSQCNNYFGNGLKYFLTSSNNHRHKKVLSLDQVISNEEKMGDVDGDGEVALLNVKKNLSYIELVSQNCLNLEFTQKSLLNNAEKIHPQHENKLEIQRITTDDVHLNITRQSIIEEEIKKESYDPNE
jgi:hypothetical protein